MVGLRIRLTTIMTAMFFLLLFFFQLLETVLDGRQVQSLDHHEMLLMGLFLAATPCVYWLSGVILRPLAQITHNVNVVAKGAGNAEMQHIQRTDEFGILAKDIEDIAEKMNQHANETEMNSQELARKNKELQSLFIDTITALAKAVDARDSYISTHSFNVANYAYKLAKQIGLDEEQANNVKLGGLLHDIGKIGVPESLLNKQGRLTEQEKQIMNQHPTHGFEIVKHLQVFKDRGILDIILYHHERVDGKGYPLGLKGNEIPLVARIVGIADAFDAMTTNRSYRTSMDRQMAIQQLITGSDTQFDGQLVYPFLKCLEGNISGNDDKSENCEDQKKSS